MFSFSAYLRRKLLARLDRPWSNYQQRAYNNLEKLYRVITPGDVLLVEGRSEMSRIIKLFSSSHWSHAALYVGDGVTDLLAPEGISYGIKHGSDARHMVVEAYSGEGVIASPLRRYHDYNIRICRPHGIESSDLEQVIGGVIEKLGFRYDDQNIVAIAMIALQAIFKRRSGNATRACLGNCNDYQVICSGMIAQAFQSVGYPIVPELQPRSEDPDPHHNNPYGGDLIMRHYTQISPKHFDLSPNFEIIKYNLDDSTPFDYKSLWARGKNPGAPLS